MNKKNGLLLGCLALLLVLSVGYALFSETITINGTATAKGNVDLTITKANITEIYGHEDYEGIVNSSSFDIADNIVTTNVSLGAPGSIKYLMIKIENTGTIPVRLKNVEDVSTDALIPSGNWFGAYKRNSDNTTLISVEVYPDANYFDDYVDETIGTYETNPDDSIYSAVLDPGEITYYTMVFQWSENTTSQEEISMTFKFKLNWEQVTN